MPPSAPRDHELAPHRVLRRPWGRRSRRACVCSIVGRGGREGLPAPIPHRLHGGLALDRGFDVQVARHAVRELLEQGRRSGTVPHAVEQGDSPAQGRLVVAAEQHRPPHVLPRLAATGGPLGGRPGGLRCHAAKSEPLRRDPFLQVRRRIGDVHPLQEVAPIVGERHDGVAVGQMRLHRSNVGGDPGGVEADFALTASDDRTVPEGLPKGVEGLPQGTPRVFLVELGPEKAEEGVAAAEAVGRGGGEVWRAGPTAWTGAC